jgi:hypothetical protein
MTFLHCLVEIKEITLGGTTWGIVYNFLFKVIITLRGLESYTTIGLAQKNITNFERRNITQNLFFEGLDVV